MVRFALWGLDLAIRSLIFAIPTGLMAQWCDIPLTWKSLVFFLFCCVWSDVVSNVRKRAKRDPSPTDQRKSAAEVMTPAQVAAAARETMRGPISRQDG